MDHVAVRGDEHFERASTTTLSVKFCVAAAATAALVAAAAADNLALLSREHADLDACRGARLYILMTALCS